MPNPDVIVIGGGPGGSATSTLLAKQGYTVELYERETFPRFHIGESLIPFTFHVIEKLGLLPTMQQSHFTKKHSVQFVSENGKLSEPFYFADYDPHQRSQTWQVRRSEFDHILLKNARENGVKVYEGARVIEVLFEGKRATGIRVKVGDEPEKVVHARVIVDASGQSTLIMDRMGLRQWDPELKKGALWTYWKHAYRDKGRDEGPTMVMQTKGKKGWFWYIPLHDDIVSVGVVASYDYLFQNRTSKDLETIYNEEVERCPGIQPRIANAERCDIYRAQKEYSYMAVQAAGDGWTLVGDALGFLDPLYSSGVLLALTSANMAAETIGAALKENDTSEKRLRTWEAGYFQGMNRMRRLVCAFYDGLSFGRLVRNNPDKKGLITDVLIGNLFKDEIDELWPLVDAQLEEQRSMESELVVTA